ncbi:MAG: carboxypeptidase regulatory-like domain-containing protein [Acidobacteria bacterium]|nr:MAG: carboxypeptidase regulatory-like domain-containing protein [Acidobacteriota bacterium]
MVVVDAASRRPLVRLLDEGLESLVVEPGLSLPVTARSPDGKAVAAGEACARWRERLPGLRRGRDFERCAMLAGDEPAVIAGLPAREVELTVQAAGFLPATRRLVPADKPVVAELEPGVLLAGRVVDPGGDPIAGVVVRSSSDAETESAADGTFAVASRALPTAIELERDGYRRRTVTVLKAEDARKLVVELEWSEQARFTPVGDGELELAAAKVYVERFRPPSTWSMSRPRTAVEDGEIRLDLPGPGRYRLSLRLPGYRDARLPEFEVGRAEVADLGTVEVERGAGVEGQVVDAASGEPLAGVHLRLTPLGTAVIDQLRRGGAPQAVTGDDGRFLLAGLEAGRYELLLRRDGFARAARDVELAADEVEDLGTVELGTGVRVVGRVVDRSERPRAGVWVRFFEPSGQALEPLQEVAAGADGGFELQLEAGEYLARVYDQRLLLAQPLSIPETDEHEIELRVSTTRLAGVVVRRGEPVAGGLLTLVAAYDPGLRRGKVLVHTGGSIDPATASVGLPESYQSAAVEADGTFLLDDAAAGPMLATYYPPNGRASSRRIQVPDRDQAWVTVELQGVEVSGRVIDRDSELGLAASVRLRGPSGEEVASLRTAADGTFVAGDLEPGEGYAVEAQAEGYATAVLREVTIEDGSPPLLLALERGGDGTLSVRLRRADGSAAAGSFVTVLDAGGSMVRSLPADAQGRRDFDHLPAGTYFLVWSDPVAGTGISEPLRVSAAEPVTYDVALPPGVGVDLRCVLEECAGGRLEAMAVYSADGLEIGSFLPALSTPMRFSADGRLALGRLAPGRYVVRAFVAGRAVDRVVSLAGERVTLSIP